MIYASIFRSLKKQFSFGEKLMAAALLFVIYAGVSFLLKKYSPDMIIRKRNTIAAAVSFVAVGIFLLMIKLFR